MNEHPRLAEFKRMLDYVDDLNEIYANVGKHETGNLADLLAGGTFKSNGNGLTEFSKLKPGSLRRLGMEFSELAKQRRITIKNEGNTEDPFSYYVQLSNDPYTPSTDLKKTLIKKHGKGYKWQMRKNVWTLNHPLEGKAAWTHIQNGRFEIAAYEKDTLLEMVNDFLHQIKPHTPSGVNHPKIQTENTKT